jgi:iron complex transport system ATP-binding protein
MNKSSGFTLSNAGFAYNDVPVVRDLDLELLPGKFYGIVGPNGCGKTTLLDLLTGNKCSNDGSIMYGSQSVATYRRRDLARQVALVPQDYAIGFSFTVEEVVLMGRHPYINRFGSPSREDWLFVEKAMADIGITAFRTRYVNELSGGEKQRVVVARALAQNTPVLLFDEATSSLDVQYSLQIFNVARSLVMEQQRTVIAVIHNLNLAAAYCDELIFMKEGRIVSCGPTQKVMEPNTIRNVFGVEARVGNDAFSNALQVSIKYWS